MFIDFNMIYVHQEHQQSNSEWGRLVPTREILAQASEVSDSSDFLMGEDDYVSAWLPPPDSEAINANTIMSPGLELEDDMSCDSEDDLESSSSMDNDLFSLMSEESESESSVSSVEDCEYAWLPTPNSSKL